MTIKFDNVNEMRKNGFQFNGFHLGRVVEDEPIILEHISDDRYRAYQRIATKEGEYDIRLGEVVKM